MTCSGMPKPRSKLACKPAAAPGIFYHYTSLETLWAILKNGTLRATQARFSNDSEELRKGADIMQEACKNIKNDRVLNGCVKRLEENGGTDIDCYIVCFCGQDDILSQWRGYCRSDGVSIGFAFDEGKPRYYLKDMPGRKQMAHSVELYPVWYVGKEKDCQSGEQVISREKLVKVIGKKLEKVCELSGSQDVKAFVDSTIPLIKHVGFCEENEFRLLICNEQLQCGGGVPFPLDSYVEYTDGGEDGIRRPYITLSFGRNDTTKARPKDAPAIEVETYGLAPQADRELKRLLNCGTNVHKRKAEKEVTYRVKRFRGKWSRAPQILISEAGDDVQKKAFESIDRILTADAEQKEEQLFKGAKLWCKGHLPIRSIRVSPCQDQKEVIESIEHYCTHCKYWLKYVEVVGSDTPYRRPK